MTPVSGYGRGTITIVLSFVYPQQGRNVIDDFARVATPELSSTESFVCLSFSRFISLYGSRPSSPTKLGVLSLEGIAPSKQAAWNATIGIESVVKYRSENESVAVATVSLD